MTSTNTERRITIARAALAEVGGDPERIYLDSGFVACRTNDHEALRAIWIAVMTVHGPDCLIQCELCAPLFLWRPPCTPVSDVLAGVTCQPAIEQDEERAVR